MSKIKLDPDCPDHHDPDMCTCPACKPEQPCTEAGEFVKEVRIVLGKPQAIPARLQTITDYLFEACDIIERLESEHQICKEDHKYLANSHEYPCPWCVNAKLEAHITRLEGVLKERTRDEIHALIEKYGNPQYKTSEFALYDVISAAQQLRTALAEKEKWIETIEAKVKRQVIKIEQLRTALTTKDKILKQITEVAIGLNQSKEEMYERARDMQELADDGLKGNEDG